MNRQAEATNYIILKRLKQKLDSAKGRWNEELLFLLWAYRTTPHSTMGETLFQLTYGVEVFVLIEIV